MKKSITLFAILFVSLASFAQQGINYKAILKDGSGNLLAGTFMNVQFTIHETTETGTIVYQEDHNYTTDANGLLIHNIGSEPSPSIGVFADIDWGADKHFLQVTIAYSGGTVNFDATEFMAVPYAKHAESANFNTINNVTSNNPGDLALDSFVFGSSQMDDDPAITEDNLRMFFNKTKGAIRAGLVHAVNWDNDSVGDFSVAFGLETKATGQLSVAMGGSASATGLNAISIGNQTQAIGQTSVALGAGTVATGVYSTAMNLTTKADALATTAIGRNNVGGGNPTSWVVTDPLFEIGYGASPAERANALTVLKNGSLIVGSAQFDDDPSFTEDDSRMFFNKTKSAIRAGFSDGDRWSDSNVGQFSTAFGFITTASGARSTALGSGTIASGFATTAIGNYNAEDLDAYFIIGNGLGDTARKNALVVKSNGDFIVGSSQMDDDNTTADDNARVFFNKSKGAFRAGLVDDTYWDDSEVGSYSVAIGLNNKAKGQNSVALGGNASATGLNAISIGNQTQANAQTSVALGAGTETYGAFSTAMNLSTKADAFASTAIGRYNLGTGNNFSWDDSDPLFEIGNGSSDAARSNALTVLKNGTITAPSLTNSLINTAGNKALVTKEYADNLASSGLASINEGEFQGWRLIGRDPSQYNDIGAQAIDFSAVSIISPLDLPNFGGATFQWATAFGVNTKASGLASFSGGRGTLAESSYSVALGLFNVGGGDPFSAVGSDPLFEIGNGSSNATRKNALTVLKNGNTGIGRPTPSSLLEVAHQDGAPTSGNRNNAFSIRNLGTGRSWQMYTEDNGYLLLFNDGNYRGSFNASTGAYGAVSDRRVKSDIVTLDKGTLEKVMKLNPVSYQMKVQLNNERHLGLISQEVKELFPEITNYVKEHDLLEISYTELIPVLIKALQEQQVIIESQNSEIEAQNSKMELQNAKNTAQDKTITALLQRMDQLENANNN